MMSGFFQNKVRIIFSTNPAECRKIIKNEMVVHQRVTNVTDVILFISDPEFDSHFATWTCGGDRHVIHVVLNYDGHELKEIPSNETLWKVFMYIGLHPAHIRILTHLRMF